MKTIILSTALCLLSNMNGFAHHTESKAKDVLISEEKAYIAEAMNLQKELGNHVWPGWGDIPIPILVYDEAFAFLFDYPNPPAGWYKMPKAEFRGTAWEVVQNDDFHGKTYYRQALPNSKQTPQSFTVMVGYSWVATFQTKEYAKITFMKGYREVLPPVIKTIFPYKSMWNALMGTAEKYILAMGHETFHAFQGRYAPRRLAESEEVSRFESQYPWNESENAKGWKHEAKLLLEAYHSTDELETQLLMAQYTAVRNERRKNAHLSNLAVQYEQKREWLEGLAKYAELNIGLYASQDNNYKPIVELMSVSDFNEYKKMNRFFNQQLEVVKRVVIRPNEIRFYYIGMLQALMLDRLMPSWKSQVFGDNIYLDDLLEEAVSNVKL